MQLSTEIPLQLPVSTTLLKQSNNQVFNNNPHLILHAWCLGVDSSRNKASLWKWQREFLPVKGHQQGPSTSQGVSSHRKPGKVMKFHFFSRPGKVMEIDSRFWKIHKKSWKLKGILSRNVSFFHPAFQCKDTFL